MKSRFFILLSIVFLLLVCIATADVPLTPDKISISLSKDWPMANGIDQVTITAHLYNVTNTSAFFPGQTIYFSSIDSALGKVNPSSAITGSDSNAMSTFSTSTKSGRAQINVNLGTNPNIKNTTSLNIDHNDPYETVSPANYTGEITVGETINITIKLVDKYGNLIDNKNPYPVNPEFEKINFTVSSPSGGTGAYFKNPNTPYFDLKSVTLTVDQNGTIFTPLKVDTVPGNNVVWVHPVSRAPDKYITVTGIANGDPWYLEQYFPTTEQLADGVQLFEFTYTLRDKFRNPLPNKGVNWSARNSSGSEIDKEQPIFTNQMGFAKRTFGPSTSVGPAYMTANSVNNSTLWANQTVWFVATSPKDMVLTASPQSMPSRDVPISSAATIRAKVMDAKGNPVKNELVNFTLIPNSYPEWQIQAPSLDGSVALLGKSAITDSNGDAIIYFWPGKFKDYTAGDAFVETATANCTVNATWKNETLGISKNGSVFMEWKNYPWLSVESSVTPKLVSVNGTVEITLKLIGNGWALRPKPVDVMLIVDRSGSMGTNDMGGITRLKAAKNAASTFISQMDVNNDRVGLVSYAGYTAGTGTTVNSVLIKDNYNPVNTSLNGLNANGATETRVALKTAIDSMAAMPNTDSRAIRAIILMTDGNWNWQGTPMGHNTGYPANSSPDYSTNSLELDRYLWFDGLGGTLTHHTGYNDYWYCTNGETTNQNMTNYAKSKGIRLYTISFAGTLDNDAVAAMRTMADSTGGFYQDARDAATLTQIYQKIAGQLKEDAGVNTNVNINYKNIIINSTPFSGATVFQYQKYSRENLYWHNVVPHVNISPYPKPTTDNTGDWVAPNYTLKFNVGKIKLNQTWEVVYTLKVLKEGNINIFGSNSIIQFNDGATLKLPDTFITAAYNITAPILANPKLELSDLQEQVRSQTVREWTWNRTYTGNASLIENYYISLDGGQEWRQVGSMTLAPGIAKTTKDGKFVLDLNTLAGGIYNPENLIFRVVAIANDVGSPVKVQKKMTFNYVGNKMYIKLQ